MKRGLSAKILRSKVFFFMALILAGWLFLFMAQENLGRGRITGTTLDENGNPLDEVLIVVESLKGTTKLEGKSDKKGHFAVAGMGTGMWRITASKKGYTNSSADMNVRQLVANPPIAFTLKKITGVAALSTDEEAFKMFNQGNTLLDSGSYDDALKVFEEFLAKYPEIYQIHLNVGACYFKKGDLEKAEAEFKLVLDKALEIQGDYKKDAAATFRAFSGIGEIYLKKGDFNAAQKYFSQALEISPEDEISAYNVGEIYFSNQNADEAIKYFELAVKIKKEWSKPYLKLGYVYLNKGDFAKSLEYFNKFIQMDPEDREVPQVKNIIATVEKMKK